MKPSERICKIMDERNEELLIDTRSNMPFHGALWAVIKYLDEQAEKEKN